VGTSAMGMGGGGGRLSDGWGRGEGGWRLAETEGVISFLLMVLLKEEKLMLKSIGGLKNEG